MSGLDRITVGEVRTDRLRTVQLDAAYWESFFEKYGHLLEPNLRLAEMQHARRPRWRRVLRRVARWLRGLS